MARHRGAVCCFCRRENQKLFLKGERCYTDKCSFERRNYGPGQHGQRRSKLSEFGQQLREKQKAKRFYGMMERQFRIEFDRAANTRGVTADIFFRNLEMRLDNAVYRMGFAVSRSDARQVVRHCHVLVNGKRVNIPSAHLKVGDEVKLVDASSSGVRFQLAKDHFSKRPPVAWLQVDHGKNTAKVIALPQRDDVQLNVKERMIVELYNK
jgi:small subunit ribosomal protein S4